MQTLWGWFRPQDSPNGSDTNSDFHYGPRTGLLDEERMYIRRRQQEPNWTLDRGTGFYKNARTRNKRASLVETGRYAGRSRVKYVGIDRKMILKHVWRRDFFGAAVDAPFVNIILALTIIYIASFLMWGAIYYTVWIHDDTCFFGFVAFQSAFLFAIETQQTIGFGVRAPGDCWVPAWMMTFHTIFAICLDAVFMGIVIAKISHPKNRGRTILISDCAVIARRDGVLKFMFRVADIRKRSVMSPKVHVYLYRWGAGRRTAEGEHIPVRAQELHIGYVDGMMLLPVTIEHNIDEASPLYGYNQQTLEAEHAEIVVTFEGTNEFGDAFMARRSYLPSEVHWGFVFTTIISPARPGETQHCVDLSRFHDVEPQEGHDWVPPSQMSKKVLSGGSRTIPAPLLGENTLVLSDDCVIASRHGKLKLMFRVGDSRPGQMLDVRVRAWVMRWHQRPTSPEGEELPHECQELSLSPSQPLLIYPTIISHTFSPSSPIHNWSTPEGLLIDADAEVIVTMEGVLMGSGLLVARTRTYDVLGSVKWGFTFQHCVVPPVQAADSRAYVVWGAFHSVVPLHATSHHTVSRFSRGGGTTVTDEAWPPQSSRASDSSVSPSHIEAARLGSQALPHPMDASRVGSSALPPHIDVSRLGSGFSQHEANRCTPSPSTTWGQGQDSTQATHTRTPSWQQNRSLAAAMAQFQEFQHQHQQRVAGGSPTPPSPSVARNHT